MTWLPDKLARLFRPRAPAAKVEPLPLRPNPTHTRSSPLTAVAESFFATAFHRPDEDRGDEDLNEVTDFGSNPGKLRMYRFLPGAAGPAAPSPDDDTAHSPTPLIILLHGCNQSAKAFAEGSGWLDFAREHAIPLLLPEQRRRNNATLCFNWYQPTDVTRDTGEALSIRQMIAFMRNTHQIDDAQVYICGLSAGGAMTAAMLASYPEIFAGGAIVAGLPFGAAGNLAEALSAMTFGIDRPAADLGQLVRSASPHNGPWPRLTIWHGEKDTTVSSANALALEQQWRHLHDLGEGAYEQTTLGNATRRVWSGGNKLPAIETHLIDGMDHGVPIDLDGRTGAVSGMPGPYMHDVGLSSTHRIAEFWGIPDSRGWRKKWLGRKTS